MKGLKLGIIHVGNQLLLKARYFWGLGKGTV